MAQFENAFQGYFSLLRNKYKETEKQPDYKGTIDMDLEEAMKLAEWLMAQPGEENFKGDTVVKIPLVGWDKESKNNPEFKYIGGMCSAQKKPKTDAETKADLNAIY